MRKFQELLSGIKSKIFEFTDETSAIRGCLSDLDSDVKTCDEAGENCIKCNEEFCNLQGGKSYIECVFCSSENDKTCGYTQDDTALLKLCEQLLGRENLCFAYGNGTFSLRGCLNDYPELKPLCSENSEDCQICDDDACNSMKIIEQLCIVCDSSVDPDCRNLVGNKTPTLCGEGSADKSGCYLSDKGKSGTISLRRKQTPTKGQNVTAIVINSRLIY